MNTNNSRSKCLGIVGPRPVDWIYNFRFLYFCSKWSLLCNEWLGNALSIKILIPEIKQKQNKCGFPWSSTIIKCLDDFKKIPHF